MIYGKSCKPKLLCDGYLYYTTTTVNINGRSYWGCTQYLTKNCNARIITHNRSCEIMLKNPKHNHKREFKANVKNVEREEELIFTIVNFKGSRSVKAINKM